MTAGTRARWASGAMWGACCACAGVLCIVLVAVLAFVAVNGARALGPHVFTMDYVAEGLPGYPGGLRHALLGTGALIALAAAVGVPMGILAGIYLAEYGVGSRMATPVRFVADVLTGVPSIVVGILGYELLVVPFAEGRVIGIAIPWMRHLGGIGSFNAYAGAAALAFIMIPIVARTTEEMLRLVPRSYREASIALGATRAHAILGVVLPAALGPTLTGVMLALARIAGETAPLLFTVAGASAFHGMRTAFPALTLQIFSHVTGRSEQRDLAWAGVLVLVAVIFLVNLAVRLATRRRAR